MVKLRNWINAHPAEVIAILVGISAYQVLRIALDGMEPVDWKARSEALGG